MISANIKKKMSAGSWIRKMFEEGTRLKKIYGEDKVYDFSLGNPDLEPPQPVLDSLVNLAKEQKPGLHGYMNNAGYPYVRAAIAEHLSKRSALRMDESALCMTVGAAGAINVALKSLLDPGDEVIILAPFFVEYLSYVENHGGRPVVVACDSQSLLPDAETVRAAITPKTKAIILNSPNNPSGKIYSGELLSALDSMLQSFSHTIYVLSDEPYIDLVYDGATAPESLKYIKNLLICFSWSKSLSLAGERIGFLAVSPRCEDYDNLCAAAAYCNRSLGFVNAPALFQRLVAESLEIKVDVEQYEKRRNLLLEVIRAAGFEVNRPEGGLYLFMKTPIADDKEFAGSCAQERILLVPGSGFGYEGFARLCFAVPEKIITNSAESFRKIAKKYS